MSEEYNKMDEKEDDFQKEENIYEEIRLTSSKDEGSEDYKTCDESMGESDNFKGDKGAMRSEFASGDTFILDGQQFIAMEMERESKVTEEYLKEVESATHLGEDQPKIVDNMEFTTVSSRPTTVNDECGDLPGNVKKLSKRDGSYDAPPWTFRKGEAKINEVSEGKVIVQTPAGVHQGAPFLECKYAYQFEWDFPQGEESVEEMIKKDIRPGVKDQIPWNLNGLVASEKKKAMQESLAEARTDKNEETPYEMKEFQSKNEPKDTPRWTFGKQECLKKANIDSEGHAIVPTLLDDKHAASLDSSFGDQFECKSLHKQGKENEKLKQEPIKGYEEQVAWDMQVIIECENEEAKQSHSDRPHKLEEIEFRPYSNPYNGNRSSNSRTEIGKHADYIDTNLKELNIIEPIYDVPRWTFGNQAGLAATNTFNKGDQTVPANSRDDQSAASSERRYEDHHHGNSAREYEHGREEGKQVSPSKAQTAPKYKSNGTRMVSAEEKKPLGSISSTTMGKFGQTKDCASLDAKYEPIYDVPRWTFGNRGAWKVSMDSKRKETVPAHSSDEEGATCSGYRLKDNYQWDNPGINGKEKVKLYASEPEMETIYENVDSTPKAASVKCLDELNDVKGENTDEDPIYEYLSYSFSSGGAIPKANTADKREETVPTDHQIEQDAKSIEFKFEDQFEWNHSNYDKYAADKINEELCIEAQHSLRQEQKRSGTTRKTEEGRKLSILKSTMEEEDDALKGVQKYTENIYDNLSFTSDERKDPLKTKADNEGEAMPTQFDCQKGAASTEYLFQDQPGDFHGSKKYQKDKTKKSIKEDPRCTSRDTGKKETCSAPERKVRFKRTNCKSKERPQLSKKAFNLTPGAERAMESSPATYHSRGGTQDASWVAITEDAGSAAPVATADSHVEEQPQAGATRQFATATEAFRRLLELMRNCCERCYNWRENTMRR
ncbi:uncharacterized protein LOC124171766 [Ischnura elegans]|uniref:uncharacterized protein LOC124171766 n=1 Tax=Ischnura elegans TaxID=197161 RepID=UPI001ED87605|nr:uncharacterized protein LOC124171766 [Ischnura elegans]